MCEDLNSLVGSNHYLKLEPETQNLIWYLLNESIDDLISLEERSQDVP